MRKGLLFLLAFMAGCSDSNEQVPQVELPDGAVFTENFIQTYVVPSKMSVRMHGDDYILLKFSGREVRNTDKTAEEEYKALSVKANDVSYNNKLVPNTTYALAGTVTGLDIVCDKDVDANHGAGVSLNDIVKICATSSGPYIASKYDPLFVPSQLPDEFKELDLYKGLGSSPVFVLLKEIGSDGLNLVAPEMYLYFANGLPAGQYKFTVSAVVGEETLSGTVTANID